jgi:DNA polymerase-4
VKLRAGDFTTATRQLSLPEPVESPEELVRVAQSLLEKFAFEPDTKYRLAGVGLSGFDDPDEPLGPLFE